MSTLPSFFQTTSITVLDELVNFELGGNVDDGLDGLIDSQEVPFDEETFGGDDDAFGDLKEENLPEFFSTPRKSPLNNKSEETLTDMFAQNLSFMSSPPPSAMKGPPPGLTPQLKAPPNTPAQPSTAAPSGQALLNLLRGPPPLAPLPGAPPLPPLRAAPMAPPQTPPRQPELIPVSPSPKLSQYPIQASYATLSGPAALCKPFSEQNVKEARTEKVRGKYMTPSDVNFITGKALQSLQSIDPYSDDYYFLQFNIKKNLRAREKAAKELKVPPPVLHVPLPAWKETKDRIKQQMEVTQQFFEGKVKQWEQKEQVLGHQSRTNVGKPREQLALPSVADMDFDLDQEDTDGEFRAPFSSRLWTTRLAVQQGFEALYMLQELQHLQSNPVLASNPVAAEEIRVEIESAVSLLSQSLGVRSLSVSLPVSSTPRPQSEMFSLDGRHIAAILQTTMGKKLLSRGLKLLPTHQRWTLVPVVLARLMATSVNSSSSSSAEKQQQDNVQIERTLLKTIIEFLQYSYQHQQTLKSTTSSSQVAHFTDDLLRNLRQCLKNVLVTLMEKNSLRDSVLSERTRAEIMNVIVEIGDQVQPMASRMIAEEWEQTREAFMSVLEN